MLDTVLVTVANIRAEFIRLAPPEWRIVDCEGALMVALGQEAESLATLAPIGNYPGRS